MLNGKEIVMHSPIFGEGNKLWRRPMSNNTSSANDLNNWKGTIHSGQSTASCHRKLHMKNYFDM